MLSFLILWICLFCEIGWAQTYPFQKVEYFPPKVIEEKKIQDMPFSSKELWQSPDIAYAFLTHPSIEAGTKYLLWQKARRKHLEHAMNILNQISEAP